MYGTSGGIASGFVAGTGVGLLQAVLVPVPAISCVRSVKKRAGYLDMSEICVNTHILI